MESPEFLLKWNNYHNTLNTIFTQWWKQGVFVDCTLVIERREIKCHRFVLSACSPFFENLLISHSAHPHPLIILHDITYEAVYSLLEFMYRGEVHVSKELFSAVVKAAGSLKIKGISDSHEIAEFSKQFISPVEKTVPISQLSQLSAQMTTPNMNNHYSTALAVAHNIALLNGKVATKIINPQEKKAANQPLKKRRRVEEPLPLSPPESQNSYQNRVSPQYQNADSVNVFKEEPEEETSDNELQIDESASISTSASSSRASNTPGSEIENQDLAERLESAKSLASLATHGAALHLLQQHSLSQLPNTNSLLLNGNTGLKRVKTEAKNNSRRYTIEQLQQAVEAVLQNRMTPAKAIHVYDIPRRTFFRKLSNERRARGIISSRENASDAYLSSPRSISPPVENGLPIITPNMDTFKHWQNTAKTIMTGFNQGILNMVKEQPPFGIPHYIKAIETRQKENEGVINDSRPVTDPVSSSNSSEKPLGEKNGFDN